MSLTAFRRFNNRGGAIAASPQWYSLAGGVLVPGPITVGQSSTTVISTADITPGASITAVVIGIGAGVADGLNTIFPATWQGTQLTGGISWAMYSSGEDNNFVQIAQPIAEFGLTGVQGQSSAQLLQRILSIGPPASNNITITQNYLDDSLDLSRAVVVDGCWLIIPFKTPVLAAPSTTNPSKQLSFIGLPIANTVSGDITVNTGVTSTGAVSNACSVITGVLCDAASIPPVFADGLVQTALPRQGWGTAQGSAIAWSAGTTDTPMTLPGGKRIKNIYLSNQRSGPNPTPLPPNIVYFSIAVDGSSWCTGSIQYNSAGTFMTATISPVAAGADLTALGPLPYINVLTVNNTASTPYPILIETTVNQCFSSNYLSSIDSGRITVHIWGAATTGTALATVSFA